MASQTKITQLVNALIVAGIAVVSCGCLGGEGPVVGKVSGLVTLDGNPLENATVSFHPESGRGSVGRTGTNGRYELLYVKGRKGATVGPHKVTITSRVWAEESRQVDYDENPESGTPNVQARDEILLPKYHLREETILSADVKAGSNEFNFELESK